MGEAWRELVGHKHFNLVVKIAVLAVVLFKVFGALPLLQADAVEGVADPRGFRFMRVDSKTGEPVRYPCSELHYVINPSLATEAAIADVHTAIKETSEATGIAFVFDGTTDEVAGPGRESYQPDRYGHRWAPILIGWQPGLRSDDGGHAVGVGGSEARPNRDGVFVFVSGQAVFDPEGNLNDGFGGKTWGQVMLHELGHVVGLDHVETPDQVMNPVLGLRAASWGNGDRIGLRALGIGSRCVPPPDLP